MADNKLELVVTVEVDKANQSIKSVNASLSGMEASATKSAKGATQGIDGMTAAMVKGATAGSLFADAIKSALAWAKDFTVGSVMMAAENAKAEASLRALATAHGIGAAAASKQVAAIEDIGFEFTEAAHAVQRLIVADMDLAKSEGLAKLAKDAAAVQNVSAGEAMESIVLAIESGASRGLRTLGNELMPPPPDARRRAVGPIAHGGSVRPRRPRQCGRLGRRRAAWRGGHTYRWAVWAGRCSRACGRG